MRTSKLTVAGAVAATTVLAVLGAVPAQAGTPAQNKGPDRAAAAESTEDLAPDRVAAGVESTSPAAASALDMIQQQIAEYVAANDTEYTFGSYVDPATGDIVLETDAPDSVVSSLTDLSRAPAAQREAAAEVQVRQATTTDTWHRRDDIPAYWGGAGLIQNGGLCSSGYAVENAAGTRFSVTAGHCYANGATVSTESGANVYGTVSQRRLPTVTGHAMDMELIGGQAYAGRIYTGGVTSVTSIPVVSAGAAVVGYNDYCHSGRTTGEQCGHTATSTTGQVCTGSGCKTPVIVYTGGVIQQGGDSGGTFYAKNASGAWIRGHVIASSSTTGYVQPWTVVANEYSVSIVN